MTLLAHASESSVSSASREVLKLQEITLEYPDGVDSAGNPATLKALDSVSFSASAGEMTAIVGASGSGKSSLLWVAATLVKPTAGTVLLDGASVGSLSDRERAQLRAEKIGIIFQQPNLLPSLTAREQLVLVAHMNGARGKALRAARSRADDLLDMVGLSAAADRRAHQLSGGQRQRVNIARALMGSPSLLLADEPTSALDAERSASIVSLLADVTGEFGVATVMVTHDLTMTDSVDHVVQMNDGVAKVLK
ncbi:ABC transporter ATP-binding protein [Rothia aerolata]|uniref:ABC transporter ATP-binding protein n=1 Tax=Rothia aerolata TaxID=1812262 RepID=A0A917MUQ2_9MICC|nr:ABC transporter ATP-binding protein [Rothia aerolata]GGH64941.1 ABC transporter ATP-binding protein [Rothia aerolata]